MKIKDCLFGYLLLFFSIGMCILSFIQLAYGCGFIFLAQTCACIVLTLIIVLFYFENDKTYSLLVLSSLLLSSLFIAALPIYTIFVIANSSLCGYQWCTSQGSIKELLDNFKRDNTSDDYSCSGSYEYLYYILLDYSEVVNITQYSLADKELDEAPIIAMLVILSIFGIISTIVCWKKIKIAFNEKYDLERQVSVPEQSEARQSTISEDDNNDTTVVFIQVKHTEYLLVHDQGNED